MIYFDYAASCPMDADACDVFVKASKEYFANANSVHDMGGTAASLVESCRKEFSRLLDVPSEGIFFTSGGSESNFLCIHALLSSVKTSGKHIITSYAEHSSVHSVMKMLEAQGYEVSYLPLTSDGMISLEHLQQNKREDTILVSIQHGNSEIGAINPIKEIGLFCKENNIYYHSDMVHTFGKLDLTDLMPYVDACSISSHKFYGPKGCGVSFVHPSIPWQPYYPSSTHERGFRPGTINVPAIASMTTAAQKIYKDLVLYQKHFEDLREIFKAELSPFSSILFYEGKEQLPSTIGLRIRQLEGQFVMLECSRLGFAISTGSACQTGHQNPSKTMVALGLPTGAAKEFIRISFGVSTTVRDVVKLCDTLKQIMYQQQSVKN